MKWKILHDINPTYELSDCGFIRNMATPRRGLPPGMMLTPCKRDGGSVHYNLQRPSGVKTTRTLQALMLRYWGLDFDAASSVDAIREYVAQYNKQLQTGEIEEPEPVKVEIDVVEDTVWAGLESYVPGLDVNHAQFNPMG